LRPTALLPFLGSRAADFIALKNALSSAVFEPANIGILALGYIECRGIAIQEFRCRRSFVLIYYVYSRMQRVQFD
jgi:hypothetical protein